MLAKASFFWLNSIEFLDATSEKLETRTFTLGNGDEVNYWIADSAASQWKRPAGNQLLMAGLGSTCC
jgi:hypothetical protein